MKRHSVDEEKVSQALRDILEKKIPYREVSRRYKIPKTTLIMRVKNLNREDEKRSANGLRHVDKVSKYASRQLFSMEQEGALEAYLLKCSRLSQGLTPTDFRQLVYSYAVSLDIQIPQSWHPNPPTKKFGEAGITWTSLFMRRHPALSMRKPENTSIARLNGFTRRYVTIYYDNLKTMMSAHNFAPSRIYNLDETALSTVLPPPRVIAKKGSKQVRQASSGERGETMTIAGFIAADGKHIPPMYIIPRTRYLIPYTEGCLENSLIIFDKGGYMTGPLFMRALSHMKAHISPPPSAQNPVLLIMDNHVSHLTLEALEFCSQNHIHIVTIPPHTSNELQPLDLTVFGPFKKRCTREFQAWVNRTGMKIQMENLARLSSDALKDAFTPSNIQSGFRKGGIVPFDFSDIFQRVEEEENERRPVDMDSGTTPANASMPAQMFLSDSNESNLVQAERELLHGSAITEPTVNNIDFPPASKEATEFPPNCHGSFAIDDFAENEISILPLDPRTLLESTHTSSQDMNTHPVDFIDINPHQDSEFNLEKTQRDELIEKGTLSADVHSSSESVHMTSQQFYNFSIKKEIIDSSSSDALNGFATNEREIQTHVPGTLLKDIHTLSQEMNPFPFDSIDPYQNNVFTQDELMEDGSPSADTRSSSGKNYKTSKQFPNFLPLGTLSESHVKPPKAHLSSKSLHNAHMTSKQFSNFPPLGTPPESQVEPPEAHQSSKSLHSSHRSSSPSDQPLDLSKNSMNDKNEHRARTIPMREDTSIPSSLSLEPQPSCVPHTYKLLQQLQNIRPIRERQIVQRRTQTSLIATDPVVINNKKKKEEDTRVKREELMARKKIRQEKKLLKEEALKARKKLREEKKRLKVEALERKKEQIKDIGEKRNSSAKRIKNLKIRVSDCKTPDNQLEKQRGKTDEEEINKENLDTEKVKRTISGLKYWNFDNKSQQKRGRPRKN